METKFGRFGLLCAVLIGIVFGRPSESERVQLWYDSGNEWPPKWQPASEEFQQRMIEREVEIMDIPGANERWENWMQFTQAQLVPKFTERGFDLKYLPKDIYSRLSNELNQALADWDSIPEEQGVDAIYGPTIPRLIPIGHLAQDVLKALRPMHEEWGGMELVGTSVYGIRVYTNGSSLVMHNDKPFTHVISSIVFLGAEYDDKDIEWPIQIEDHDGKFHEVNLQPGQVLHYESARCPHGRLKPFRGRYYAALFVHYQPTDRNLWNIDVDDVIAAVPPHWNMDLVEDEGSRWAGQALTIDSLAPRGASSRVIEGEFIHARRSPWAFYEFEGQQVKDEEEEAQAQEFERSRLHGHEQERSEDEEQHEEDEEF